jgi:uncharacterized coiled-coil protein SlyX
MSITIYNKGKNTIITSAGRLVPGDSMDLPTEEAKKLVGMYPKQVSDTNSASVHAGLITQLQLDNGAMKESLLRQESTIKALTDKITEQQKTIQEQVDYIKQLEEEMEDKEEVLLGQSKTESIPVEQNKKK